MILKSASLATSAKKSQQRLSVDDGRTTCYRSIHIPLFETPAGTFLLKRKNLEEKASGTNMGLYDNLTYESDESSFSQSTLLILGVIFVISFLLRMLVSNVSKLFGIIVRTIRFDKKRSRRGQSTGSVAGYAFAFVTLAYW